MSLPAEILEHILSFLESDTATLKACSQSHPILSQLVERPLYANVTVQNTVGLDSQLHAVLRDRPHVANYVHALEIIFEWYYAEDREVFLEETSSILPKLSKLRKIGFTTRFGGFSWRSLSQNFRVAFLECLRWPSLMDVCINGIPIPLYEVNSIQNLSLRHWSDDHTTMAGGENASPCTIDSLALYDCWYTSVPSIISWINLRDISSLTFSGDCSLFTLPRILNNCSHSLANLDIDIGQGYRTYYDFKRSNIATHPTGAIPIPISVLPHLQRLTLHAQVECANNQKNSIGTWGLRSPIFAIAKLLKPASSLKHLNLDFYIFIESQDYQDAQHEITDVLCNPLHSLLVQSASTINLRANSIQEPDSVSLSPNAILSIFSGCVDLVPFVENGRLTLTPGDAPVPVTKPERQVQQVAPWVPLPPLTTASGSRSSDGRTLNLLRKWSKKLIGRSTSKPSSAQPMNK